MQSQTSIVAVHQALFGYEDGHRLLASSAPMRGADAALLLPFTDLVPGVDASRAQDYWTGIPLNPRQQYALMRTWTAPEMPRPGCVWTQVLLIEFSEIGRFVDLSVLASKTARPALSEGFGRYSKPMSVDAESIALPYEGRVVPREDGLTALRSLYASRGDAPATMASDRSDDIIFALWSQQWPELRRTFAFRSAPGVANDPLRRHFHIQARTASSHRSSPAQVPPAESWEEAALDDLKNIQPTPFRQFLWRYGRDVRKGREQFRALAQLYTQMCGKTPERETRLALAYVASILPDQADGLLLKRDLIACRRDPESLIPAIGNCLETLTYLVNDSGAAAFPGTLVEECDELNRLWPEHSTEILGLAERACEVGAAIRDPLLSSLSRLVSRSKMISTTEHVPAVRAAMLRNNPSLLDNPELESLPQSVLADLLRFIPDTDTLLANAIVVRLLRVDNPGVATDMLRRFPEMVTRLVIEHTEPEAHGQLRIANAWLDAVSANPEYAVSSTFMSSHQDTASLARLSRILGQDCPQLLRIGPLPWAIAVRYSNDNIQGPERLAFLTFLLVVTVERPEAGAELLLEKSFEPIHRALEKSVLPWDAFRMLTRHLPSLSWWDNWDNCRRLRLAVVHAYIKGGLDPQSFRRLTTDKSLLDSLASIAEDTAGGRSFITQVFA